MSATPSLPYGIWTWPGRDAAAGAQELRAGELSLVLFLAPVSLVVSVPPFPADEPALTRFCRELAHSARRLACEFNTLDLKTQSDRKQQ